MGVVGVSTWGRVHTDEDEGRLMAGLSRGLSLVVLWSLEASHFPYTSGT